MGGFLTRFSGRCSSLRFGTSESAEIAIVSSGRSQTEPEERANVCLFLEENPDFVADFVGTWSWFLGTGWREAPSKSGRFCARGIGARTLQEKVLEIP